jgi:hypothetical protein
MPQTTIFLEDLGPGEKEIAEMLASILIRRLNLCFSIVSITQGSSGFIVVTGAWMGGTTIGWETLVLVSMPSSDFPS